MRDLFLKNAYVYRGRDFAPADVLVQEGVLAAVGPDIHYPVGTQVLDLNGMALVPGFIDVHTHGGDGIDVNAATVGDLQKIGAFFARHGTTGWLCSILTDTEQQTLWCIDQARQAIESPGPGARLLGIHLEGPFLATAYKGAMPQHLLRQGDAELFRRYQEAAGGAVRYLTVSPEVEGVLEMIAQLSKEVAVAIGHSGADYETSMLAIANGAAEMCIRDSRIIVAEDNDVLREDLCQELNGQPDFQVVATTSSGVRCV